MINVSLTEAGLMTRWKLLPKSAFWGILFRNCVLTHCDIWRWFVGCTIVDFYEIGGVPTFIRLFFSFQTPWPVDDLSRFPMIISLWSSSSSKYIDNLFGFICLLHWQRLNSSYIELYSINKAWFLGKYLSLLTLITTTSLTIIVKSLQIKAKRRINRGNFNRSRRN